MVKPIRLAHHVAEMVALEASMVKTLDQLVKPAIVHADTSVLIESFRDTSLTHLQTLRGRLQSIAKGTTVPETSLMKIPGGGTGYPVSSALQQASVVLNHAIVGYAMLRTIALRNRDSILAGDGNTGDIAEQHAKNYASAVHKINQVLHNVVVWEMDREGGTCQCTCPSCSLGICLCAQAPRRTLSDTWSELGPISTDTAVTIQQPRPDSAAAVAGLGAGDIVVAADGQELDSHFALQGIISAHQSDQSIELRVLRISGGLENVKVVCP